MKVNQIFQKYGILIVLILMCAFFTVTTGSFLTIDNLFNIVRQVSIMGIVAVGMTIVLLTGGIDLSVGALLAVSGVTSSVLMVHQGINPVLAILAGIAATSILGLITGTLIQK